VFHQKEKAKYLLGGGAGLALAGLTKTETEVNKGSKCRKDKKARKQLRYRRSKKRNLHKPSGLRPSERIEVKGHSFFVAGKKTKISARRKNGDVIIGLL
jgi:hypothetical protein